MPNDLEENANGSSCPAAVIENVDKISEIIEIYRHVSSRSNAQELKIDHKTVLSHLSKVGFKKKLDVWVPGQLTPENMMDRLSICESLAKRNEIDSFLKRMVTGDEKWVTYENIALKRSWSNRSEAAQTGQTLNSDIHCRQLDRLKLVTDQKRPELANRRGVVFHQNNARPHTSVLTVQKLWELDWKSSHVISNGGRVASSRFPPDEGPSRINNHMGTIIREKNIPPTDPCFNVDFLWNPLNSLFCSPKVSGLQTPYLAMLKYRPRHLTIVQNYEVRRQNS
ncbi:histone-lysine N-methyltransferase SETMAR [Trichonephila clavipes]|nr:histone-lysine N-methyltransferase SETMAR [Trichonephila clavipes]